MAIKRYTTSTQTLTLNGIQAEAQDIYVTFRQGDYVLTFNGPGLTVDNSEEGKTKVTVILTQEQTAKFATDKKIAVQVNILDGTTRDATDISYISVGRNLLEQMIE